MAMFAILCVDGWQFSSPEKEVSDQWLAANKDFLVDGRTIRGWAELFILDSECNSEFKKKKKKSRHKQTGYFPIRQDSYEEKALLQAVNAVSLLVRHQMRLITTAKSVMWVYHKAKVGDEIVILQNCIHVVLRPVHSQVSIFLVKSDVVIC